MRCPCTPVTIPVRWCLLPPRMVRALLSSTLLVLACATPSATSREAPGDAETRAASGGGEDLSQAWEREPEKPAAAPVRPPEVEKVDRAEAHRAALATGQAALKSKRLDDARTAAQQAVTEAATLDGEARFTAHQLAFRVELAAADVDAAQRAAHAWRLACGPEKLDACRSAAVAALGAAAKSKGADKQLGKLARAQHDAELCAVKAEKGAKPHPCEATTLTLARRGQDPLLAQRVLLGQALREGDDGRQGALLEKTEGACDLPQCAGLRRKALTRLVALARAKNDVDGAVKLALREVAVVAAGLPEDERTWTRTALLDQTCVSYDTAHAPGSCRALEKKTLGRWTFHDYSRERAGQGLSADQVRVVNEHFAPLLQECLAEQARRMTPPDAQRFEVRWVVFNDGRVGEAHLRKDLDETLLAKCLRAQFAGWRYPRYEGEYQNVEQSFTVTAVERRALR